MAAALAKVLRGGRSGPSSSLIPAICRCGLQEGRGGAALLPRTGSSPTALAVGMDRLMHTNDLQGQRPYSFLLQKGLPFERHGDLCIWKRRVCNLPRVGTGIKALKHKYMVVPGYEVYGSQFSMLHISDQLDNLAKWKQAYQKCWPYPAGVAFMLIIIASSVLRGYSNHKNDERLLAETKANIKKSEEGAKETEKILKLLECEISQAEAVCK